MRSSFILFTSLLFVFRAAGSRPQGARANTLGAAADVDYSAKTVGQVVGFSSVKDSVIDGFGLWS